MRGDYVGAELLFRRVLEGNTENPSALAALGKMLYLRARSKFDAAHCHAAGSAVPAEVPVTNASVAADCAAAEGCFKRVLEVQPSNATALFYLGTIALAFPGACAAPQSTARSATRHPREAEAHFRHVLRVAPAHVGALRALAELCQRGAGILGVGNLREAPPSLPSRLREAQAAMDVASTDVAAGLAALRRVAEVEEVSQVACLAEAEALLRRALALEPQHVPTLVALANVLRPRRQACSGLGGRRPAADVAAAERLLRLALRLCGLRLQFSHGHRGVAAGVYCTGQRAGGGGSSDDGGGSSISIGTGDTSSRAEANEPACVPEGTSVTESSHANMNDACNAMLRLAELLTEERHEHDEAAELLRGAVWFDSAHTEANYALGELLVRRARGAHTGAAYKEAERLLSSALRVNAAHAFAAQALAVVFVATGRVDEAESLLRRIVSNAPHSAHAKCTLGRFLYTERGDTAGAAALLRATLQEHPTHVYAMGLLAELLAYEAIDGKVDVAAAEMLYKQALAFELHPVPTLNQYGDFLVKVRGSGLLPPRHRAKFCDNAKAADARRPGSFYSSPLCFKAVSSFSLLTFGFLLRPSFVLCSVGRTTSARSRCMSSRCRWTQTTSSLRIISRWCCRVRGLAPSATGCALARCSSALCQWTQRTRARCATWV